MKSRMLAFAVFGLLALGATASAQYNVRTMAAPKATLTNFRTFHLLPTPVRRDGASTRGKYHPMAGNSVASRLLRETIAGELESRGYVDAEWMPDFVVAVYASVDEKLDLDDWLYGYPTWPRWTVSSVPEASPIRFEAGTVVIDVLNPETLDLLWRGIATSSIRTDPAEMSLELANSAAAVVNRFPRAKPVVVAKP